MTIVCRGMIFSRYPVDSHTCALRLSSCEYQWSSFGGIFQLTSKYMLNFFDKKNHDRITRVIKVIALLFQRRRVRHLSNETFGKVHLWPNLSTGKICHGVQKKVSFRPIMCPEKVSFRFQKNIFTGAELPHRDPRAGTWPTGLDWREQ